jgi:hypothetical protein
MDQVMAPPQKKRASKQQVDYEDTTMPEDCSEDTTLPENAMKPPAKKKGPAANVNKTVKKSKDNPNMPGTESNLIPIPNDQPPPPVTQNPSTQDSVSCTLDFEEQVASLMGEDAFEIAPLLAHVERVIEAEVVEEDNELVHAGLGEQPLTIQDKDLPPSLEGCLKEWHLSNPSPNANQSGGDNWIRIWQPKNKIYEVEQSFPLEKRAVTPGINQWMTTHRLSFQVRWCFPNIGRKVVANVNTIVSKIKLGCNNEIDIFPREDFIPLSPPCWKNSRSDESPLTWLSQFDIGERGDGRSKALKLHYHFFASQSKTGIGGFLSQRDTTRRRFKNLKSNGPSLQTHSLIFH